MAAARVRGAIPLMLAALATVAGLAMAGCSTSSKSSSSGGSATTAVPEDLRATAAEVGAGLKQLESIAVGVATATGSDKGKAKSLTDQIEPVWKKVEGTVKANDKDAYVSFEDNFTILEKAADSGNAAKAQQAAGGVSTAVAAYLSKFPG